MAAPAASAVDVDDYVTRCVVSGRKRDAFYATLGTVESLEAEITTAWPTASQGKVVCAGTL